MKISYIANARIPTEKAHGIQITKMAETFADSEIKPDVELVLPKRINEIKENPFKYYGVKENFRIKFLPCLDLIAFDKYVGSLGLLIESITFFLSAFFYYFKENEDIIYTRNPSLLPLTLLRKNVFLEMHTLPNNYFLYNVFFKRLKGIIVITNNLKDSFVKKGISEDKILVAADAVDLKEFDIAETQENCRKKLGISLEQKIILYTGHLYRWKGVQALADSVKYLPENAVVYFVGGTKEDIKEFASKNSGPKMKVVGYRPHLEIPFWLKAADILVLPNSASEKISLHWTSPLKLFEYMAAGRPIVASDIPSIREVLNEDNSLLVPPDHAQRLGQAFNLLLTDQKLAEKISNNAYQQVKKYTWERRIKSILEFIIKKI